MSLADPLQCGVRAHAAYRSSSTSPLGVLSGVLTHAQQGHSGNLCSAGHRSESADALLNDAGSHSPDLVKK